MSPAHVRPPIACRFVNRCLERRLAGSDLDDSGAEKFHARNIQRLALHVDLAHVDYACAAETRCHGRGGHAVLTRAGLSDDAPLTHALREQNLAERVVDLMRAGMQQILALEINFCAAEFLRQALGEIERGRPACEIAQQGRHYILKSCIAFCTLRLRRYMVERDPRRLTASIS